MQELFFVVVVVVVVVVAGCGAVTLAASQRLPESDDATAALAIATPAASTPREEDEASPVVWRLGMVEATTASPSRVCAEDSVDNDRKGSDRIATATNRLWVRVESLVARHCMDLRDSIVTETVFYSFPTTNYYSSRESRMNTDNDFQGRRSGTLFVPQRIARYY